jgi:integrase
MAVYTTPESYVFASSTGRPFNADQLRWALQDALKGLGITFDQTRANGMHLLQHSSGSIVYRHTGGDVKQTQAWLGHSNSRVTLDTYTHLAKRRGAKGCATARNSHLRSLGTWRCALSCALRGSRRVARKGLIYYADCSYGPGG